jgi:hypothetical protein
MEKLSREELNQALKSLHEQREQDPNKGNVPHMFASCYSTHHFPSLDEDCEKIAERADALKKAGYDVRLERVSYDTQSKEVEQTIPVDLFYFRASPDTEYTVSCPLGEKENFFIAYRFLQYCENKNFDWINQHWGLPERFAQNDRPRGSYGSCFSWLAPGGFTADDIDVALHRILGLRTEFDKDELVKRILRCTVYTYRLDAVETRKTISSLLTDVLTTIGAECSFTLRHVHDATTYLNEFFRKFDHEFARETGRRGLREMKAELLPILQESLESDRKEIAVQRNINKLNYTDTDQRESTINCAKKEYSIL